MNYALSTNYSKNIKKSLQNCYKFVNIYLTAHTLVFQKFIESEMNQKSFQNYKELLFYVDMVKKRIKDQR